MAEPEAKNAAPAAPKEEKPKSSSRPVLPPEPTFWAARMEAWSRVLAAHKARVAERARSGERVSVTVNDKTVEVLAWSDTPMSIAESLNLPGRETFVAAKVGADQPWDLTRPLEPSCSGKCLTFLQFSDDEGRHVFWHSSAHILGQALERLYSGLLNVGPATDSDFYYDIKTPDGVVISANDFKSISSSALHYVKVKQPFERVEISREEARAVFAGNKFKLAIIDRLAEGESITAYRCGNLVDLCRGPHLPHTGLAKAFSVTSSSSVYQDGRADGELLQRVHGLSFPDKKQLQEWEALLEEAQRRDHRKIGQDQELFFFHQLSPGSAFFLPRGFHIYRKLMEFIRAEYEKRGYQEVLAPNIYHSKLWEISGHLAHYKDCMFTFNVEDQLWALKPMNCPGHCLMFANRSRSYRELPLRLAEFGVLHRNELTGALHGLTRVRRFEQDDSHIFCRPDQIEQETTGVLDLIRYTYGIFGFNFRLELSTRPEKFMGDVALWDKAESQLKNVLDKLKLPWKLNPGDGAFYGPKIDIHIQDALKRFHQCATIQLDFQLPIRFDLQYMTSDAGDSETSPAPAAAAAAAAPGAAPAVSARMERPVMIHRAVFGSIERFYAILCEHTAGKWPFWLSPRQVCVLPVSEKFKEYAAGVAAQIRAEHVVVDVDESDKKLQKKVRDAQIAQYNFILVVGPEEVESKTVSVRMRDNNQVLGKMSMPDLIARFRQLTQDHQ